MLLSGESLLPHHVCLFRSSVRCNTKGLALSSRFWCHNDEEMEKNSRIRWPFPTSILHFDPSNRLQASRPRRDSGTISTHPTDGFCILMSFFLPRCPCSTPCPALDHQHIRSSPKAQIEYEYIVTWAIKEDKDNVTDIAEPHYSWQRRRMERPARRAN